MQKTWMAAWPSMLRNTAGWKRRRSGRQGCISSTCFVYENARDAVMISHPDAIICRSDDRAPSSDRADSA